MKQDCENIKHTLSERHVLGIIYSALEEYYESIGYYVYEKDFVTGIIVGLETSKNWLHKIVFHSNPTVHSYISAHFLNDGSYTILVEHREMEMLNTSKGLCQALNRSMPDEIVWSIHMCDDTRVI